MHPLGVDTALGHGHHLDAPAVDEDAHIFPRLARPASDVTAVRGGASSGTDRQVSQPIGEPAERPSMLCCEHRESNPENSSRQAVLVPTAQSALAALPDTESLAAVRTVEVRRVTKPSITGSALSSASGSFGTGTGKHRRLPRAPGLAGDA